MSKKKIEESKAARRRRLAAILNPVSDIVDLSQWLDVPEAVAFREAIGAPMGNQNIWKRARLGSFDVAGEPDEIGVAVITPGTRQIKSVTCFYLQGLARYKSPLITKKASALLNPASDFVDLADWLTNDEAFSLREAIGKRMSRQNIWHQGRKGAFDIGDQPGIRTIKGIICFNRRGVERYVSVLGPLGWASVRDKI